MDVRPRGPEPNALAAGVGSGRAGGVEPLQPVEVALLLGEHRRRELRLARGFRECRGLDREQIEDLYQQTTIALLASALESETHLRNALRDGIKKRALTVHRDARSHEEILTEKAPAMHVLEAARSAEGSPEHAAVAHEDQLLVVEFLAELTERERDAYWLFATEGMQYNRIARALGIPVNEARNTLASCERKRERFQLLHDSGRLCGYRAATITALQAGQATSEELAQRAIAHVQGCARCRAEHHTNAGRLRRSFQDQAAALLPPVLLAHFGWLTRAAIHARVLAHRVIPGWGPIGQGGARERAAALLAGGGASVKLAAGIATIAIVAGSTITATHALEHHTTRPHSHHGGSAGASVTLPARAAARNLTPPSLAPPATATASRVHTRAVLHPYGPGRVVATAHAASTTNTGPRHEPGGFAYLGVPTTTASVPEQRTARVAAHTGGPFSP